MIKVSMSVLLILNTSLYSSIFLQNTDEKIKYEYDSEISDKNKQLQSLLNRFQDNDVNDDELKKHMILKGNQDEIEFTNDVIVNYGDSGIKRKEIKEDSILDWFNWFDEKTSLNESNETSQMEKEAVEKQDEKSSWFSWFGESKDQEVVEKEEKPVVQEEVVEKQENLAEQEESLEKEDKKSSWFPWFGEDESKQEETKTKQEEGDTK